MVINTVIESVSSSYACSLGLLGPGPGLRAEPVFEGPVVILAEHAKDEMDASVSGAAPRPACRQSCAVLLSSFGDLRLRQG